MPASRSRASVGVWTSPPNASGSPNPTSSSRITSTLGASAPKRLGSTRRVWLDSFNVGPATLADGVGGNGRTRPSAGGPDLLFDISLLGRGDPAPFVTDQHGDRAPRGNRPD